MYFYIIFDFFVLFCFLSRGRKPGSGRKNGGAGSKGKDKKLSGTESEQEVRVCFHAEANKLIRGGCHKLKTIYENFLTKI